MPVSAGGGAIRYDRNRTPYNLGPMAALDAPKAKLIVMVKPSRSGGTCVAENYIFKLMKFGPMTSIGWYLNSDEAVTQYVQNIVKPMFDANPDLSQMIGRDRGDNKDAAKKVRGYMVEWLAAKDGNFRNREPGVMVCDETDAWMKKYAASPKAQIEGRQKQLGAQRKAIIMSHPDLGWKSGAASAWVDTSRGVYIMRCPECAHYAAAYSTKHWPDVPEFRLHYTKLPDGSDLDERLDVAKKTAALACPHCGSLLSDEQRISMVDEAARVGWGDHGWMHRGQDFDPTSGINGDADQSLDRGYWVHGLMLKTVDMPSLAKSLEEALEKYRLSKDPILLREVMSKQFAEVFDGAASVSGLSAKVLAGRAENDENPYHLGECPGWVRFITAAVDVGARKFDVMWKGWDLENRSCVIDRITIRQSMDDAGVWRDIDTYNRIDDWLILLERVVDRLFPIVGREGWSMPVAVTLIDDGDGNATWKGRAFQRIANQRGYFWGRWSKAKLIKGSKNANAPILPPAPRKVDRDEQGRQVSAIYEYDLGVSRLKDLVMERLAVDDGSPGEIRFPIDMDGRHLREYFGETKIDGKWARAGSTPNETLDLDGYCEAGRQMLEPDRPQLKWSEEKLPIWAKPVRHAKAQEADVAEDAAPSKALPPPSAGGLLKGIAGLGQ